MQTRPLKLKGQGKEATLEWVKLPFHGAKHLPFLLEVYKQHKGVFEVEQDNTEPTLEALSKDCLDVVERMDGWLAIVQADGNPLGCVFAHNWDGISVEVGGISQGRMHQHFMDEAFSQFIGQVFDTTEVHLLRAFTEFPNKPARLVLRRSGFEKPQAYSGYKVKGNVLIDAIMMTLTRDQWSQRNGR